MEMKSESMNMKDTFVFSSESVDKAIDELCQMHPTKTNFDNFYKFALQCSKIDFNANEAFASKNFFYNSEVINFL